MLEMADENPLPGLVLVIDHDDPVREYEYSDEKLLQQAAERGWAVVEMAADFRTVFRTMGSEAL